VSEKSGQVTPKGFFLGAGILQTAVFFLCGGESKEEETFDELA
jgi:hypothetical protein